MLYIAIEAVHEVANVPASGIRRARVNLDMILPHRVDVRMFISILCVGNLCRRLEEYSLFVTGLAMSTSDATREF